ncbi:lysozyme inhibitor LprI family protein [Solilutibacter silvestris]|uniref:lysozyme inhibitor LprI family protein n=1 Tax=Solilutibacter silvestris TaxID=1645665 RepID=UPI003D3373D0
MFKPAAVPTNVSEAATSGASGKPAPQETKSVVSSRAPQQVVASVVQKSGSDSPKLRPSYDECISAAGGVTPSMHDCIDAEYRFQDARLNSAYKAFMAKLGGKERTKLRDAQRHWIAKRDEQCASDPDSGQAGALDAYECRLELTANRAAELESH